MENPSLTPAEADIPAPAVPAPAPIPPEVAALPTDAESRFPGWTIASLTWISLGAAVLVFAGLVNAWLWLLVMCWMGLSVALAVPLMQQVDRQRMTLADREAKLRHARERIDELAARDELTGLWNRRHLMTLLEQQVAQSRRTGEPLCIALLKIDQFEALVKQHGGPVMDQVVQRAAKLAQGAMRQSDFMGRVGRDEFLVVYPATLISEAQIGLERVRQGLAQLPLGDLAKGLKASTCGGLVRVTLNDTLDGAMDRAEATLAKAAAGGPNRIEVA